MIISTGCSFRGPEVNTHMAAHFHVKNRFTVNLSAYAGVAVTLGCVVMSLHPAPNIITCPNISKGGSLLPERAQAFLALWMFYFDLMDFFLFDM